MDGLHGLLSIGLHRQQACVTMSAHFRGPTTDILDAAWSTIVAMLE